MRKMIHKWFWAWDFEKEEKWLNEMSAKGLALISVGFCRYEFEECLPGEYSLHLELLEYYPNHAKSRHYLSFLEETGAEYIGSVTRWVYLRKKTDAFDLFDNHSRITHLNRIMSLFGVLITANLFAGCSALFHNFSSKGSYPFISILNFLLVLVLIRGILKINGIKQKLKKEQRLFE